eukprot:TRINITY_DN2772_c0_g1_i1.p1 TRINITY_DN2772_c0_g1~~TRINITY_DN2772_c0_g1_i1.p1  ORF type:complete len:247 (-),score=38.60 TRINITY_DN2772_c0_g1_i1:87-827(-)
MVFTCRHASQFCCGCSVEFGVWTILICHLLHNVAWVVFTGVYAFAEKSYFLVFVDSSTQVAVAGFALAGIPITILGMWGLKKKQEVPMRVYLYYMIVCSLIGGICMFHETLLHSSCDHLPKSLVHEGKAFACGLSRIFNAIAFFLPVGVNLYCVFIVMSHCDDLAMGGASINLADLADASMDRKKRGYSSGANHDGYDMLGEHLHSHRPTDFGVAMLYEDAAAHGVGGSSRIFNGNYHDMAYPPRK